MKTKENAKEIGAGTKTANPHLVPSQHTSGKVQAEAASSNANAQEEYEGDEWTKRESQALREQVAMCRSLLTLDNEDDFFKAISSMLLRNNGIDRNLQACRAHFRYLEELDNATAIGDGNDNSDEKIASGVDDVAEESVDDQTRLRKSGLKDTPASKPSKNVTVATKKGLEDVQPEASDQDNIPSGLFKS